MKIKYGAIVTDGVGKINGMQVRRLKSVRILQIKNNPRKMAKLLANPALPLLIKVVQEWGLITQAERDQWALEAPNYYHANSFNDMVAYNARGLFIALNTAIYIAYRSWVDVYAISGTFQGFVFNSVFVDYELEIINFDVTDLGGAYQGAIVFGKNKNESVNLNPNALTVFGYFDSVDLPNTNFWSMLTNITGGILPDTWYSVALYEINPSGFKSVRQLIKFST